ncbi:hypothetical protein HBI56_028000 [Parastagonospora nodorum]|nr:hypothetical protein HBH53_031180 [Parastagonospora nodorum]KAH3990599.1 hypothetical protein HBH52_008180 [Parastagonospora nodorum]KAH4025360.1 hypothetical protein HBI09_152470 [Parastagonospora nodorum]KAH4059563.1 hypothetical protein HBH49_019890 [Parastagonospora nodorum]KAH4203952.1 hypothetical protein HBH42_007920 [Parastagonospora nodorum]
MPSQPLDSAWNFSSVFELIGSDSTHDVISPTLRPSEPRSPAAALQDGGVGLGNFWKLYESLGMQTDVATPLPPLDESELSTSDDALLPSPIINAFQAPSSQAGPKEKEPTIVSTIIPQTPGTTKKQRRKARRAAEKASEENIDDIQKSLVALADSSTKDADVVNTSPTKPSRAMSNVGAKIRPASPAPEVSQAPRTPTPAQRPVLTRRLRSSALPVTPQAQAQQFPPRPTTQHATLAQHQTVPPFIPQLQPSQMVAPISSGLVPRTVRPVTVPRNSQHAPVQPHIPMTPSPAPFLHAYATPVKSAVTIRSQVDRHFHLFEKLLARFPDERKWLVSPKQMVNENTTAEGIHVFVDASNIMIGFKDMLRVKGVQSFDMSFDSLALLMERRRPVGKRCFVGSHREANPLPQVTRLIETSKAVGYECSVQEQVYIAREESSKKKFFNDVNRFGWQKAIQKRSGSGSDSETGTAVAPKTPSAPKWVEQGVDELLHLKMCQSMLDTETPSTMVLATGDGAEAEMSDGFLAHVERALRLGWKVELITWRQQTNGGYKRKAFRQKWGEQFSITELDDFLEDLIDTP